MRLGRVLLVVVLLSGLSGCGFIGASGTVSGTVVDGAAFIATGERRPLPSAKVAGLGVWSVTQSTTGENGRFVVSGVRPGPQRLRVEREGYLPIMKRVEVRADESVDVGPIPLIPRPDGVGLADGELIEHSESALAEIRSSDSRASRLLQQAQAAGYRPIDRVPGLAYERADAASAYRLIPLQHETTGEFVFLLRDGRTQQTELLGRGLADVLAQPQLRGLRTAGDTLLPLSLGDLKPAAAALLQDYRAVPSAPPASPVSAQRQLSEDYKEKLRELLAQAKASADRLKLFVEHSRNVVRKQLKQPQREANVEIDGVAVRNVCDREEQISHTITVTWTVTGTDAPVTVRLSVWKAPAGQGLTLGLFNWPEVQHHNAPLWVWEGGRLSIEATLKTSGGQQARAETSVRLASCSSDEPPATPEFSVAITEASSDPVCDYGRDVSHRVSVAWDVEGGEKPISVTVRFRTGSFERTYGPLPVSRTTSIRRGVSLFAGGQLEIEALARDGNQNTVAASHTLTLADCPPEASSSTWTLGSRADGKPRRENLEKIEAGLDEMNQSLDQELSPALEAMGELVELAVPDQAEQISEVVAEVQAILAGLEEEYSIVESIAGEVDLTAITQALVPIAPELATLGLIIQGADTLLEAGVDPLIVIAILGLLALILVLLILL